MRTIDSTRNCPCIVFGVAPSAFLMPISLVLSTTDTSIMFIIPIPPTSKEIAAIAAKKLEKVAVIWFAISTNDAGE